MTGGTALGLLYMLVVLLLLGMASSTLAWMLYAWRDDGSLPEQHDLAFPDDGEARGRLSFSLLVPARHEEQVLGRTLDRLAGLEHDDFEILVIVGHDDPGTAAVAHAASRRHPTRVRVVVDHHEVKNKPRALNTALPQCRGDVVAVFDAEDVVHPRLLRAVERRMLADGSAALQSGVQLMNFESSWFSVHNVLEYYFWFRSRLHFQAHKGFIPLGGNTVFVRRVLLELLQGWDGDCLAEDCDLGVRLSSHGFAVSVMYDPALVTREETPATLDAFVRQRTRWNQGFLQVLFKREWRLLPRGPQRALAVYTLCTPFLQAFSGLLLPVSVLMMALAVLPAGLAVLTFLPIVPAALTLAVQHLALIEFGRLFDRRPRLRDHARLLLGTPVFQLVLSSAALRAVVRQARGHGGWEKTAHLGLHLDTAAPAREAAA
jgi:cellulose synthase/poly-beta-1,6-N-acetylglucosamine synthase-like glycosyltransferase